MTIAAVVGFAGAASATTIPAPTTTTTAPGSTTTTTTPSGGHGGHKGHGAHAPTTTTTTQPTQKPITPDEINSLNQALSEIQQSEALSQRYDALVAQQGLLAFAASVSRSDLAATRAKIVDETAQARTESINEYIMSTPSPAASALFAGVGTSGAQSNYASVASGTTQDAIGVLLATAAREQSELSSQQADVRQIAANARAEQTLVNQAETVARGALAVITTSTGDLRNQYLLQAALDARQATQQGDAQESSAALVVVDLLAGNTSDAALTLALDSSQLLTVDGTDHADPKQTKAVTAALSQVLVPYHFGGETPGVGFDCSGLTQWAWGQAGVSIPRTAAAQWHSLTHVPLTALEPGDLLFYFNLDGDHQVDHVVMYLGAGPYGKQTIIAAPHTGSFVGPEPLFTQGLIGAARP